VKANYDVIHFWDTSDGHEIQAFRVPGESISGFALAPDGKTMIVASYPSNVFRVVEVPSGNVTKQIPAPPEGTFGVNYTPDVKTRAIQTKDQIQFWETKTWHQTGQIATRNSANRFTFIDNRTIVAGVDLNDEKSELLWWDVSNGREIRKQNLHLKFPWEL